MKCADSSLRQQPMRLHLVALIKLHVVCGPSSLHRLLHRARKTLLPIVASTSPELEAIITIVDTTVSSREETLAHGRYCVGNLGIVIYRLHH